MRHLLLAAFLVTCFAAADWPRFRGSDAVGVATPDCDGPTTWTATTHVKWKVPTSGFGASSPVTRGDKIYLTGYSGYGTSTQNPGEISNLVYHVTCYDRADGSVVWSHAIRPARSPQTPYRGMAALHGYAAASVAVDDDQVYAFFGNSGVYALSLAGEPRWHVDVGARSHGWNSGASPILWNDVVIVNASVESASVVGLDKATGKQLWSVGDINDSWGTPLIVRTPDGDEELVVAAKNRIVGVDPESGRVLWNCEGVRDYICSSVIAHEGIAYITGGRSPEFIAVRTGGRGDVTETHRLWHVRTTPKVSTPIYWDGHIYFLDQTGRAVCLDAKTGETIFSERLEFRGRADRVYSSLVQMGGKFYGFSREDGCAVLAAKPEFQLLAHNHLGDDSIFNATPVVDNGQILIRSDRFLYCIEE